MTEFSQTYWNELIEKYKNGTISEQGRFQLEKQALDDPFLFDALEGFSILDERFKEKKTPLIKFTLLRLAIAASLVLLVAVIFNLQNNLGVQLEQDQSIAMVLEKDNLEFSEKADSDDEVNSNQNSSPTTPVSVSEPKEKINSPIADRGLDSKDGANVNETEAKPGNAEKAKEFKDFTAHSDVSVDVDLEPKEELAAVKNEKEMLNTFDEKEDIVDVIKVIHPPEKGMEITNASSFESVQPKPESNLIFPETDNRKEEFEKSFKKAKSTVYYEAVPVIGKEIFDDYAKQRIDERGLRQESPQKVTIEFRIDKNGNLTDFHHIFTGCSECGPLAISILQKSGEWKTVPPGFSGKARYTFTF